MGYAQSWIAVKSERFAEVLAFLELRPAGTLCQCACLDVMFADMRNGWHIVVSNEKVGFFFTEKPEVLAEISLMTELLAGAVEEHVNYSVCEFWHLGKRLWKVERLLPEMSPEIVTEGDLPECFLSIKEECEVSQAVDENIDHIIEIPLRVCEAVCGYVHDRAIQGLGDEAFEELDSIEDTECETKSSSESTSKQADKKRSWFNWFHKD